MKELQDRSHTITCEASSPKSVISTLDLDGLIDFLLNLELLGIGDNTIGQEPYDNFNFTPRIQDERHSPNSLFLLSPGFFKHMRFIPGNRASRTLAIDHRGGSDLGGALSGRRN